MHTVSANEKYGKDKQIQSYLYKQRGLTNTTLTTYYVRPQQNKYNMNADDNSIVTIQKGDQFLWKRTTRNYCK